MQKIKITWEEDGKTIEKELQISRNIDNMKVFNICRKFGTLQQSARDVFNIKVDSDTQCHALIAELRGVPYIESKKSTQDLVSPGSLKKILEQFPGAEDSRKSPTTPNTVPQSPTRWTDRGSTGTVPQTPGKKPSSK